jgi:tRNA(Arg) A34 adenosine deaminase TadA
MTQDERFMKEAIRLSEQAVTHGNEPFGAVLVKDGEIVFTNENQIYTASDPTYHAEAGLLRNFCASERVSDLTDYTLYSSCEPCFMCCGAIVWTKLGRLVFGSSDIDLCAILGEQGNDCCGIVFSRSANRPQVTAGVLREESLAVLESYFSKNAEG